MCEDPCVLFTEQINLHLKLDRLQVQEEEEGEEGSSVDLKALKDRVSAANNVLKVSEKLLKQFAVTRSFMGGYALSPFMYNIVRLVMLSGLSALLSEVFGFKLHVWKLMKGS